MSYRYRPLNVIQITSKDSIHHL